MSNPAFDAALLLRGLRAMDAALGESYNVMNHTCIPAPVVYSAEFPKAGIDFRQYQGITGVQNTWRGWMYEDGGKGALKVSVHEDVEATVVEAFGILDRCDKSKDGLVAPDEWTTCQKGKSAEDQLFDLEYLLALNNVTGKMIVLEKDQPLNPADPNTYPELIQARGEMTELNGKNTVLQKERDEARDDASFYQTLSYGLGGGLGVVALALGVRAALRKRKPPLHPDAKAAIVRDQNPDAGIPPPAAQAAQPAAARIAPPPLPGADYGALLGQLAENPPPPSVLEALAGDDAAADAEAQAEAEAAQAQAQNNPPPPPATPAT